jgi:hypothetical protein
MGALTVTDADDLAWTVRIQWRPRFLGLARRIGGWRRKRHGGGDQMASDMLDLLDPYPPGWSYEPGPDLSDGGGGGGLFDGVGSGGGSGGGWLDLDDVDEVVVAVLAAVVALLAVIAAVVLFWWVLLPVLLLVLDGLLVVLLFALGTLARMFLRRPWTVLATSARGDRLSKKVVGLRSARQARDDIASEIRNGAIRSHRAR